MQYTISTASLRITQQLMAAGVTDRKLATIAGAALHKGQSAENCVFIAQAHQEIAANLAAAEDDS